MKEEVHRGLLESSNISFGHMLRLDDYESQLQTIVRDFLDRKDVLLANLCDKGSIVILIKVYSSDVGLVAIDEIIHSIYQHLDEDSHIEIANDIEENIELKDYFNLTLIEV